MTSDSTPSRPTFVPYTAGFELSGEPAPLRNLLVDTWASRELLVMLSRKEFFAKYRRASFGVLWAALLPLVQAVVLAVVLSRFVRFHTGGSYASFIFAGTLPWNFFNASVAAGTTSVVDNSDMSSKIYFPRAVFPLMIIGAGIYGLGISLVILIGFAAATGGSIGIGVLALIPGVVLLVVLTSGVSLLLGALDVYFRDLKFLVQAVLLPMFYVTPIFYPLDATGKLRGLIAANPMTGVVQLFHVAVGSHAALNPALWWTAGWSVVVLLGAAWVHRRYDRNLSDLL